MRQRKSLRADVSVAIKSISCMATAELCKELGATEVHIIALIDLPKLGGSKKLAENFGEVITLLDY